MVVLKINKERDNLMDFGLKMRQNLQILLEDVEKGLELAKDRGQVIILAHVRKRIKTILTRS